MKQKILLLLAGIWFGIAATVPTPVVAASLINGQTHYYSVQLRSDKQAIIYGKIIFTADKSEEQKELTLKLPEGVNASNLSAQQILAKSTAGQCAIYETYEEWADRQLNISGSTRSTSPSSSNMYEQTKRCVTYDQKGYDENYDYDQNTRSGNDFYSPYYYIDRDDAFEYKDIEIKQSGQSLQFVLPETVKPDKQGAFLVSFTTHDYIDGNFGYYNYSFRTLIAESLIESTSVGVDFDDDLYSSQAKQERTAESVSSSGVSSQANTASSAQSSISDTQQTVGKGGRYIKTQGKMLPGDTLEVRGTFATNPVLLMGKQIGILIILLLAGVLFYLWYRRYRKSHPKPAAPATVATYTESSEAQPVNTSARTPWLPTLPANPGLISLPEMIKISLLSIVVTIISVWVVTILFMGGDMYDSSGTTGILSAELLAITILTITLFGLVIIPGLNVLRYGVKQAYAWSLVHFVTLLIVMFVLSSFLSALAGSQSSGSEYEYRN